MLQSPDSTFDICSISVVFFFSRLYFLKFQNHLFKEEKVLKDYILTDRIMSLCWRMEA